MHKSQKNRKNVVGGPRLPEPARDLVRLRDSITSSVIETKSIQASLRSALAQNAVRVMDLFAEWDTNGDHVVSKAEFRKAIGQLGFAVTRPHIDSVFDTFDHDGSGEITYKELVRVCQHLPTGRRCTRMHARINPTNTSPAQGRTYLPFPAVHPPCLLSHLLPPAPPHSALPTSPRPALPYQMFNPTAPHPAQPSPAQPSQAQPSPAAQPSPPYPPNPSQTQPSQAQPSLGQSSPAQPSPLCPAPNSSRVYEVPMNSRRLRQALRLSGESQHP